MEEKANDYMEKIKQIEEDREMTIIMYNATENPLNEQKANYLLKEMEYEKQLLELKTDILEDTIEARETQSELIKEHSDLGYDQEEHEEELENNKTMISTYQQEIEDAKVQLKRNEAIQAHFREIDPSGIENFEQYAIAYMSGIQEMSLEEIEYYDKYFEEYSNYVEKYGEGFNKEEVKEYIASYKDGISQGKDREEINDNFYLQSTTINIGHSKDFNDEGR